MTAPRRGFEEAGDGTSAIPMRLYVAGPMTGYPRWNFDAFERAAAKLRAVGYEVLSPAEHDLAAGFDPDAPAGEFTLADRHAAMRRDLETVLAVDGVALLDGWEASEGARVEATVAASIGLPVSTVGLFLTLASIDAQNEGSRL